MDGEVTDTTTTAEETKAGETATQAATTAEETKAATLLDGGDDGQRKDGAKSLLDDEVRKPDEGGKPGEGEGAKPPTAEEIDAWMKEVPALDLGDGVKWDDAALKAMAPSLMGLGKEKSNEVIKAYADYAKDLAKRQAEAADAFNNGLIQECQKRFGDDLRKVVGFAKTGGRAIFGDRIWNEMKTIPAFANNPDIMERLAEFGRKVSTDGGKVSPSGGGDDEDRGDVLHRMYGGVKP